MNGSRPSTPGPWGVSGWGAAPSGPPVPLSAGQEADCLQHEASAEPFPDTPCAEGALLGADPITESSPFLTDGRTTAQRTGLFPKGVGVEEWRGRLSLRPRGEGSHQLSAAGWEAQGTAPLPTRHLQKLPQAPPPRPSRSRIWPPRTAFLGVTLHNVAQGAGQGVAGQVVGLGPGGGGHEGTPGEKQPTASHCPGAPGNPGNPHPHSHPWIGPESPPSSVSALASFLGLTGPGTTPGRLGLGSQRGISCGPAVCSSPVL